MKRLHHQDLREVAGRLGVDAGTILDISRAAAGDLALPSLDHLTAEETAAALSDVLLVDVVHLDEELVGA